MIVRFIRCARSIIACSGLGVCILMMGAIPTKADRLVFRNSRAPLVGEVISDQAGMPIRFRYRNSKGEWVTASIPWSDVDHIEREEGDQSDGVRETKRTAEPRRPALSFIAEVKLRTGETLKGNLVRFDAASHLDLREESAAPSAQPRRIDAADILSVSVTTDISAISPGPPVDLSTFTHSDLIPILRGTMPPRGEGDEVIVIKLRGTFLPDNFLGIGTSITPGAFDALIHVAKERRPKAIVLSIDSDGGYVTVMKSLIERVLDEQRKRGVRLIAWPENAGSAAAILSLACEEIVVTSTTRMGAAIAVDDDGEQAPGPRNAMEQKMLAWETALTQLVHEHTGRDTLPQRAMEDASLRVWFHPARQAFRDQPPTTPDDDGWVALDENQHAPLVLTGDQLRQIKFALPNPANHEDDLLISIGMTPKTSVHTLDLGHDAIQAAIRPLREQAVQTLERWRKMWDRKWRDLSEAQALARMAIKCRNAFPEQGITQDHLNGLRVAVKKAQDATPRLAGEDRALMSEFMGNDWVGEFDFWTKESRKEYQIVLDNLKELRRTASGQVSQYPELQLAIDCLRRGYGLGSSKAPTGD